MDTNYRIKRLKNKPVGPANPDVRRLSTQIDVMSSLGSHLDVLGLYAASMHHLTVGGEQFIDPSKDSIDYEGRRFKVDFHNVKEGQEGGNPTVPEDQQVEPSPFTRGLQSLLGKRLENTGNYLNISVSGTLERGYSVKCEAQLPSESIDVVTKVVTTHPESLQKVIGSLERRVSANLLTA